MGVTYRMATVDDLARVAAFSRRAAGTEIPIGYWRWRYFDNPAGPSGIAIAFDGERIVGLISAFAVPFRIGGQRLLASQVGHNDILAPYRSSSVYFELVSTVFRELVDQPGVDFCFGVAIKETRDLSIVLMGFEEVGPIRKLVKIINPIPHLRKKWNVPLPQWVGSPVATHHRLGSDRALRGFTVGPFEHFGDAHDLAVEQARGDHLLVCRDASYLEWRYTACPLQHYEKLQLSSGDSVLGWVVYHVLEEQGIRYGVLDECFGPEEDGQSMGRLVDLAVWGLVRRDVSAIVAWAPPSTALYQALRGHRFVRRPSPRSLIARAVSDRVPAAVLTSEDRWYYTIGDTEYWLFPVLEGATE